MNPGTIMPDGSTVGRGFKVIHHSSGFGHSTIRPNARSLLSFIAPRMAIDSRAKSQETP